MTDSGYSGRVVPSGSLASDGPLARAERLRWLQSRNAERVAMAGDGYDSLQVKIRAGYKHKRTESGG